MLEGGAEILQFRHKGPFTRAAFETAERLAAACRAAAVRFFVNDRADIALLLDAGLHIGQDDLSPVDARRVIGAARALGISTHNAVQLAAALSEPADYVAFGPIFATQSKHHPDPVVGLDGLREARRIAAGRVLVAIGGIRRENGRSVLAAGADSVAVIHDILPETCTRESVRARMEEWQQLVKI